MLVVTNNRRFIRLRRSRIRLCNLIFYKHQIPSGLNPNNASEPYETAPSGKTANKQWKSFYCIMRLYYVPLGGVQPSRFHLISSITTLPTYTFIFALIGTRASSSLNQPSNFPERPYMPSQSALPSK